jgi:hypothetical protein
VDDFLDEIVVELRRLNVANAATRSEIVKLIEETGKTV